MFTEESFNIFDVPDLAGRMEVIRSDIQPIFAEILEQVKQDLDNNFTDEFFIHIAQHIRRTKNAPESTWAAISTNKRGYKSEPHFQLGIWQDYIFIYLSMIDGPKNKSELADYLLENKKKLADLSSDYVYSIDHTKQETYPLSDSLDKNLLRFRDVKKAEFEFGRLIKADSNLLSNPKEAMEYIKETYKDMFVLYKDLLKINKS
jgi:Uncharacterized protein conserved in bacteria